MLVSIPSCADTRASFCTVCCCLTMTTHNCASNKPSCASAWALYFGNYDKECWRWSPHGQAHELSISHRAQAHELPISHCAQAHKLLITAATTTYVDDKILRASTRGIYIALRDSNNNNNSDDDNECRRQGLGREHPAFSYRIAQRQRRQQLLATTNNECWTVTPRAREHNIFSSHCAMATTTMSSSHLRVKHRYNNKPGNIKIRRARATSTSSNIDDLVRKRTWLSSAIIPCAQVHMAFSHRVQANELHSALCIVVWRRQHTAIVCKRTSYILKHDATINWQRQVWTLLKPF